MSKNLKFKNEKDGFDVMLMNMPILRVVPDNNNLAFASSDPFP